MINSRSRFGRRAALAALLAVSLMAPPAAAQDAAADPAATVAPAPAVGANLNISPKRLTFDRTGKSATLYVFNQGQTPATFDVSLVDRIMTPAGQITPVTEAAKQPELADPVSRLNSAKSMLLATPRRVTLQPGKGQTIRVRVNPGAEGQAPGEYRSHLTVTTIPPRDIGLTAEQAAQPGAGELKFIVHSVFGISVPVIVRLGDADIRAAIENASLSYADISPDGVAPAVRTAVLSFDLARQGANSLFGNLEVTGAKGKEPIGLARGVGVYTEIDRRAVRIPLNRAPEPGERLQVTFTDDDTSPGKVLAQSVVAAP